MNETMNYRIVKAPIIRPRKPHDTWGGIVKRAWELPSGDAVEVPCGLASSDRTFRAAVHNAAARLKRPVSVTKSDGFYLVQKRENVDVHG